MLIKNHDNVKITILDFHLRAINKLFTFEKLSSINSRILGKKKKATLLSLKDGEEVRARLQQFFCQHFISD